jgi:hypothetical protein
MTYKFKFLTFRHAINFFSKIKIPPNTNSAFALDSLASHFSFTN